MRLIGIVLSIFTFSLAFWVSDAFGILGCNRRDYCLGNFGGYVQNMTQYQDPTAAQLIVKGNGTPLDMTDENLVEVLRPIVRRGFQFLDVDVRGLDIESMELRLLYNDGSYYQVQKTKWRSDKSSGRAETFFKAITDLRLVTLPAFRVQIDVPAGSHFLPFESNLYHSTLHFSDERFDNTSDIHFRVRSVSAPILEPKVDNLIDIEWIGSSQVGQPSTDSPTVLYSSTNRRVALTLELRIPIENADGRIEVRTPEYDINLSEILSHIRQSKVTKAPFPVNPKSTGH